MNDLDQALFVAAREGDSHEARRLIASGANVNAAISGDPNWGTIVANLTPLMVAAGSPRSNGETVKVLLANGADIRLKSEIETTALWYGAGGMGFSLATTDMVLEEGHPYLDWGGGDVERLRLLLDAGADPNEVASNSRTAVGEAASAGDPERLRLLIERGASVLPVRDEPLERPIPMASDEAGMEAYVKDYLSQNEKLPPRFNSYAVPLYQAAEGGSAECVRLILDEGFPADFTCAWENAIHHAKSVEVVELLWSRGVGPALGAWNDGVQNAFSNERYEVGEFMLSKLRDWDSPTSTRVLLQHGAEVDALNSRGETPLMLAADQGAVECVRLLLAAGADSNLTDQNGLTAKDHARERAERWRRIVSEPPQLYNDDPEKAAARHKETLAEAVAVSDLLGI